MKYMDKILLAVDFGQEMYKTVNRAVSMARKFNAKILPVHAIDFIPYQAYVDSVGLVKERYQDQMASLCVDLGEKEVELLPPVLQIERPRDLILRVADEEDVNLIVLGGPTKTFSDRVFIGSTAENVIRHAHQPVMTVHDRDDEHVKNILCPFDFSPAAAQALNSAIHMAHLYDAFLNVYHVGSKEHPEFEKRRHMLTEYVNNFDLPKKNEFDVILGEGNPSREILRFAEDEMVDTIVMGAQGKGNFLSKIMGNTTTHILRSAPCSIITVNDQDLFKVKHDYVVPGSAAHAGADADKEVSVHMQEAKELMKNGFASDAVKELKICLEFDQHNEEACQLMAEAHDHMGSTIKASYYRDLANAAKVRGQRFDIPGK